MKLLLLFVLGIVCGVALHAFYCDAWHDRLGSVEDCIGDPDCGYFDELVPSARPSGYSIAL